MLTIAFGCTRFHQYIFGMPTIEVETDHKPLEAIFRKPLYQAPARLQKVIMSIQKYSINLVYRSGKQLVIADTLSRAYLPDQSDSHTSLEFEVNVVSTLPILKPKLNQLQSMTQCDPFTVVSSNKRLARSQVKGPNSMFAILVILGTDIIQ